MAPTLKQLRAMSDQELEELHDRAATHTEVGTQWYIDEVRSRELARQTQTLVRLTWVITALTVANVAFVGWTLFE